MKSDHWPDYQWSGYCAKDRDEILRMIERLAALLFGAEQARQMSDLFPRDAIVDAAWEGVPESTRSGCDELLESLPTDGRTIEPVHAMLQDQSLEFRRAMYRRLAWTHLCYSRAEPGAYLIPAVGGFLLPVLFLHDGRPPPLIGFSETDDWPYELQTRRPEG